VGAFDLKSTKGHTFAIGLKDSTTKFTILTEAVSQQQRPMLQRILEILQQTFILISEFKLKKILRRGSIILFNYC